MIQHLSEIMLFLNSCTFLR